MAAVQRTVVTYTLTLSEEEAKNLMDVLGNLSGEESTKTYDVFDALDDTFYPSERVW